MSCCVRARSRDAIVQRVGKIAWPKPRFVCMRLQCSPPMNCVIGIAMLLRPSAVLKSPIYAAAKPNDAIWC